MNFIDYLVSIAPEGETVLFVKQIPKPDLFHKDGAQQCAWPAYLPTKYDKKEHGTVTRPVLLSIALKMANQVLLQLTVSWWRSWC